MIIDKTVSLAMLATVALAGCSQSTSDNQPSAGNSSAPAEADAANTKDNGRSATVSEGNGLAPTSVSSAMPVPGTNTPEHIVVEENSANDSTNHQ